MAPISNLKTSGGPVNVDGTYNGTIELRKLAKPAALQRAATDLSLEAVPGEVSMSLGDFTVRSSRADAPHTAIERRADQRLHGPLDIRIERGDLKLSRRCRWEASRLICGRAIYGCRCRRRRNSR